VTIELPALRERLEDVPLLVERLVQRAARETGKSVTGVSEAALALLRSYDWPGNVRELAHTIERAVVLANHEVLSSEDFPRLRQCTNGNGASDPRGSRDGLAALLDDRPSLRELQRRYALAVLEENGGNVSRTASALGIDRRSLHRLLQRYRAPAASSASD
jgi:DNA-binding NtrC family response regulator